MNNISTPVIKLLALMENLNESETMTESEKTFFDDLRMEQQELS